MAFPILLELGLNGREVDVYETLLKLGEAPMADVLSALKVHPQLVYRAVDSLSAKGLVQVSFRRHRKYVRAEDPRILEKREEKRLSELRQELPKMLQLQSASSDAIVRVEKGLEAARDRRETIVDALAEGSELLVIGGSGDRFFEVMGDRRKEIERKRRKKGVSRRVISFVNQKDQILERDKDAGLTDYRFLESDYSIPSSTLVWGDAISLFIWNADPLVVTIESRETADSYRSYFETLWKLGRA